MIETNKQSSANSEQLAHFLREMDDNLNTPKAFAVIEQSFNSELLQTADTILGLGLNNKDSINTSIEEKINLLDRARTDKNFDMADKIRAEIISAGYEVMTDDDKTTVRKK